MPETMAVLCEQEQVLSAPPICSMRTLQIGDHWFGEKKGGLGRYFLELIRHLPATGTSSLGLVVGTEAVGRTTHGEVKAFSPADDSFLSRLRHARGAALKPIQAGQMDLIASHFAPYALPILDLLDSLPSVIHFHGPWAGESGTEGSSYFNALAKRTIERLVYSSASRLVVLSECFRNELLRSYGISEERVHVVPGGIDADRFNMILTRHEARKILGWPQDRSIILAVRRQVKRMGLEELIDAAQLLVRTSPDVLFIVVGSGPLSGELENRVNACGLQRHVRLLGFMEDEVLPLAYRAADMTVVPSRSLEGFGLITLESLASGTPVFVTPVGGLPEIVRPFAPACVFADGSAKEMAGVLDDALRGGMPMPDEASCRSYAVANYSWPRIAMRVRGVYDEALRRDSRP